MDCAVATCGFPGKLSVSCGKAVLFADTEAGKDFAQQFIAGQYAGYSTQSGMDQLEILGQQLPGAVL